MTSNKRGVFSFVVWRTWRRERDKKMVTRDENAISLKTVQRKKIVHSNIKATLFPSFPYVSFFIN